MRSQEQVNFISVEIQESSSYIFDLPDQLNRTQEMISFVQENAGSNVTASLTIGQARVEPITSSLPKGGRRLHAECGRRPHAHRTEHRFCRIQFQQKGTPFATLPPPRTSVPREPTTQASSRGVRQAETNLEILEERNNSLGRLDRFHQIRDSVDMLTERSQVGALRFNQKAIQTSRPYSLRFERWTTMS